MINNIKMTKFFHFKILERLHNLIKLLNPSQILKDMKSKVVALLLNKKIKSNTEEILKLGVSTQHQILLF